MLQKEKLLSRIVLKYHWQRNYCKIGGICVSPHKQNDVDALSIRSLEFPSIKLLHYFSTMLDNGSL